MKFVKDFIVFGAILLLFPAAVSFLIAFNETFKLGLENWLLR